MNLFKKAAVIGALSASSVVAVPALASASTGDNHALCVPGVTITSSVEGSHLYITITYPGGSVTVDPPLVMD
ncbi:hypothetical protein AAC03nite_22550 [Alicyclobacillus acidoterrestris]|uniref:hypothetical protein n=1 Tax=Alicyclobacillus suci TaxID=2816080 RepID=UPI0011927B0C|nr:hypothetical protein [Alicyclobacillus suci]GEO26470.1 hypothetical protein AAC03nite_22550 [Alicyclobacillus acidoterrestris]